MSMRKFIAVPSRYLEEASGSGVGIINFSYRIGRGFHLYRTDFPAGYRGGMLGIDRVLISRQFSASVAVSEILRECRFRRYNGIFFDVEKQYEMVYKTLLSALVPAAASQNIRVYIPESLASLSGDASVVLSTALSGGSLRDRLSEAVRQCGAGRIALDVELLKMDFALPAGDGQGRPLSAEELSAMLSGRRMTFFSPDLCANYFTYSQNGKTHFVLYDTPATVARKLQIAERLGISTAFFLYTEVRDILPDLF